MAVVVNPRRSRNGKPPANSDHEILTLPEAAEYLRLDVKELERLVESSEMPGRRIGDNWRFSKAALLLWLSTPRRATGTEEILEMAGKFKDDPFLNDIVLQAYRHRRGPQPESE